MIRIPFRQPRRRCLSSFQGQNRRVGKMRTRPRRRALCRPRDEHLTLRLFACIDRIACKHKESARPSQMGGRLKENQLSRFDADADRRPETIRGARGLSPIGRCLIPKNGARTERGATREKGDSGFCPGAQPFGWRRGSIAQWGRRRTKARNRPETRRGVGPKKAGSEAPFWGFSMIPGCFPDEFGLKPHQIGPLRSRKCVDFERGFAV